MPNEFVVFSSSPSNVFSIHNEVHWIKKSGTLFSSLALFTYRIYANNNRLTLIWSRFHFYSIFDNFFFIIISSRQSAAATKTCLLVSTTLIIITFYSLFPPSTTSFKLFYFYRARLYIQIHLLIMIITFSVLTCLIFFFIFFIIHRL